MREGMSANNLLQFLGKYLRHPFKFFYFGRLAELIGERIGE